jgi:hypothetical protein
VLLEAIGDIEEGVDPLGLDPHVYRDVRPAETILPPGASWRDVADKLLVAAR